VIHVGAAVVIQCKIKPKCSAVHIDTQRLPVDYATLVHCNIRIFVLYHNQLQFVFQTIVEQVFSAVISTTHTVTGTHQLPFPWHPL
jgi:hypothetical protein